MQNKTSSMPKQNPILGALKGALISTGALLPGISGGALCMVLGIYEPMMALLSHPIKEIKRRIGFFWPILVGFLIGALLCSKVLGAFMEAAETAAIFLFVGLIVGTLPSLAKTARKEGSGTPCYIALVIAFIAMLAWMIPMTLGGQTSITPSLIWWVICGVLWGLGIIVPGLSPSNIFFFLGLATPMYAGIGALDMSVCLPMGGALVLTVLLLSKGVNYCLNRWYAVFMHAVIGVVLASTLIILPPVQALLKPDYTFATGLWDIILYILCLAGGCLLATLLSRIGTPKEEKPAEE